MKLDNKGTPNDKRLLFITITATILFVIGYFIYTGVVLYK